MNQVAGTRGTSGELTKVCHAIPEMVSSGDKPEVHFSDRIRPDNVKAGAKVRCLVGCY